MEQYDKKDKAGRYGTRSNYNRDYPFRYTETAQGNDDNNTNPNR